MKQLSLKKKPLVLRLYFEGLSYDEIAVRADVSKGTVGHSVQYTELLALPLPSLFSNHG